MDVLSAQALIRFGLGPRGTEAPPNDPVAWLKTQLGPDAATFSPSLPSTADALILQREQAKLHLGLTHLALQADVKAQTAQLLTAQAPFRERLVWFWANHFTISTRQGETAALAGPFVREAIRPYVNGRFFDMLLAVMRHPAMLFYLDNCNSVGPNSKQGLHGHKGLNENLARECLELHTISPAAGYTQADVTSFAAILTGWSVDLKDPDPGFVFRPDAHEPGEKNLMGHVFPPGDAGGILALDFLAHHPATYRHLAQKLVRHFVADEPPPEAVAAIAGVLHDTRGDLGAAAMALIDLRAAWTPLAKFRTPWDYAVAALRLLALPEDNPLDLSVALKTLAEPVWNAPLPNGWADTADNWVAPEAMIRRIDWAYAIAGHASDRDPLQMADAALGPLLKTATLNAIRGAGDRRDAVTLLLTSPEFFRR
jgi:uncharacterized protein (DUF1800 family)